MRIIKFHAILFYFSIRFYVWRITQHSIRVSHLFNGACYKMTRRCSKSSWIITLLWAIVHICRADTGNLYCRAFFHRNGRDVFCGCGRRKNEHKVCAPMSMWLRAECSSNSPDFLDDDLHEHSINFKHFIVI